MAKQDINDAVKNHFIVDIPLKFAPEERGLGYYFYNNMKKYSNRVAQYVVETEEEDTYEHLLQRSIRTALEIKSRELTKQDVIVLCSNNHVNSCVPFIASIFLGIPVASLDPTLSVLDARYLLNEVKPKMLFVKSKALSLIETSLEGLDIECEIIVYEDSTEYPNFSIFLQPHDEEDLFKPQEVDDLKETAVIFFSSGTTGLPKGIMLSHYALMAQCCNMTSSGNFGSVLLSYASLYWISAVLFLSVSISSGSARIICSTFNSVETWNLIEKYRVETLFLSPSGAIDMTKKGRPDNLDTTSLTACISGGGSLAESYIKQLRDLLPGTFMFQVYGQTEISGIFTMFYINQVKDALLLHYRPNSAGKIVPGITAKVVDPETEQLCGPYENGELRVKSELIMNGYYNRESSDAFDDEGWLRSGDIVFYDEDYCFYVVDRIKEMLKFKSWHVPPAMIENILLTHPAVQRCVVIGIPNDEDGDHPMGIVILAEDFKDSVSPEELIEFIDERVPDRMKLRAGLIFVDNIPLTPSGKIKRKDIKDMVLKGDI